MVNDTEYTAEKDYIETLPDGRQVQIIAKGITIPIAEAVRLGLVKKAGASGEKQETPAQNKAEKPAAGKGKK